MAVQGNAIAGRAGTLLRVAFRADASVAIGSGHVMRCLSLAQHLQQCSVETLFVTREGRGHLNERLHRAGHRVWSLSESALAGLEDDALAALEAFRPDWLVVDHYQLAAQWEERARQAMRGGRIMVIDDLANRPHVADLLLDQNFGRSKDDYQALVPRDCRLLIGADYALLRPEFGSLRDYSLGRRGLATDKPTVLVSLGGADGDDLTSQVLALLAGIAIVESLRLRVVLGQASPHVERVTAVLASLHLDAELLVDPPAFARLIAESDIAIGAGGTSTWERACLGVPSIIVVLADNQRAIARSVAKVGAAYALELPLCRAQFEEALLQLIEHDTRLQMSEAAARLTEGNGVATVSRILLG